MQATALPASLEVWHGADVEAMATRMQSLARFVGRA